MSRTSFHRYTGVMAAGTTLSRITGLLRLVALVYAVHFATLADAYNLANTLPNVVHDVVLGGIVSATFLPVFVAHLAGRAEDEAWEAISAVVSVSVVVIVLASLAFLIASPFIIDAMTAFNHSSNAAQERTVAEQLLVLFVPQLACYGCISVATALLNARRRFGPPTFVPIANNVVLIVVLVAFGLWVRNPTLGGVYDHRSQLYVLGLGTTLGVVMQLVFLLPSLRRAGLQLRWYPRLHHPAVHRIVALSGWTVGLVLANQVALVVVLALSVHVGSGAVTAYTYAWAFFQLPYGVVAVSIMSASAPELAARWTTGDMDGFRRRMDLSLRSMLAVVIPVAAAMVVLARPLLALLGHLIGHPGATGTTAVALAMLSLGLPGFCVFLYVVRVLQSTQDLRSAFWLYALENTLNIALALALAGPLGVRGIMLSIAIAYTVAALVGLSHLRRRLGGLQTERVARPVGRAAAATVVLVAGTVLGSSISASETIAALLGRLLLGTAAGLAGYFLGAAALVAWHERRRRRQRPGGGAPALDAHAEALADAHADEERPADTEETVPGSSGRNERRARRRPLRSDAPRRARRRPGPPPPPEPLPPAGRPPLRPTRLGPTLPPGGSGDGERGRLDP
ncbi:MAG TPA: murein biosynthesis integral membrane protein MurJ [Acidimicrobiaceae bacterium]|nr:murein biosynthesis integral membrane protein MurJ [Acidimicrobiaceae bacterium]